MPSCLSHILPRKSGPTFGCCCSFRRLFFTPCESFFGLFRFSYQVFHSKIDLGSWTTPTQGHANRTTTHNTIPYHAMPYHTIPYYSYHTIPYHTVRPITYDTIPYHPYHIIPYHTIPYHSTLHHIKPRHTIPYHTIPQRYHAIRHNSVIPCHIKVSQQTALLILLGQTAVPFWGPTSQIPSIFCPQNGTAVHIYCAVYCCSLGCLLVLVRMLVSVLLLLL